MLTTIRSSLVTAIPPIAPGTGTGVALPPRSWIVSDAREVPSTEIAGLPTTTNAPLDAIPRWRPATVSGFHAPADAAGLARFFAAGSASGAATALVDALVSALSLPPPTSR